MLAGVTPWLWSGKENPLKHHKDKGINTEFPWMWEKLGEWRSGRVRDLEKQVLRSPAWSTGVGGKAVVCREVWVGSVKVRPQTMWWELWWGLRSLSSHYTWPSSLSDHYQTATMFDCHDFVWVKDSTSFSLSKTYMNSSCCQWGWEFYEMYFLTFTRCGCAKLTTENLV